MAGIPSSVSDDNLENKVLKIFDKLGVPINPNNIEACHRIKKDSDRTIVKFNKRKDCQQLMRVQKDLKNMTFTDIDLPVGTTLYRGSLCSYYRWLWSNCKKMRNANTIHSFFTVNETVKVKVSEVYKPRTITHLEDLKNIAPGYNFENKQFNILYIVLFKSER